MSDLVGIGKAAEPFSRGTVGLFRRLFGPASSELGELLADRVRVYRANNMNAVLEPVTQSIPLDEAFELPLRFAIPFIEKASREDNAAIQEMWSNLLKDAASGIEEEHHLILSVLGCLTPRSAALLENIVGNFHEDEHWDGEIDFHENWLLDLKSLIQAEIEPELYHDESAPKRAHDKLSHRIIEYEHRQPCWIFLLDLPVIMPDTVTEIDAGATLDDIGQVCMVGSYETAPLQILEREGLVTRHKAEIDLKHCRIYLTYAAATRLGVQLVSVCRPNTEGKVT